MTVFIWIGVCQLCPNASAENKLKVYVSIPPQKFFVQSIGGETVDISVMVSAGANPHNYEPTAGQMKMLSSSRIYFAIGDPFEDVWLKKIASANRSMIIVHSEDGIEKKPAHRHEAITPHQPHPEGDHGHSHGIYDPHVWLSPPLVMQQSRNILMALIAEMPENRELLEKNFKNFMEQLIMLDAELRLLFKDDANKEFLVFHPSWGYFADAYGLRQKSIEFEGKEPKAKELTELIQYAKSRDIQNIFVQPQFSIKNAGTISKEINGNLIYADPLAENWLENIKTVATSIKQALR
jgi:zinc transport system substrate-binding protein